MVSVAVLMLLLLERFLSSDMDDFTEPILNGLRVIERTTLKHVRNVLPHGKISKPRRLTKFYLYSRQFPRGQRLDPLTGEGLHFFNSYLETKMIIHGFLDKVKIAEWMHHMKDEFLILDDFNVIIVDWSSGNFLPYTIAASNTEQVGEEIAVLMRELMSRYGAKPEKFHLLGHSLGSHVSGYVGENIKGLRRISGLDPATYQFSNAPPRSKLDKSDALFVDVIHTDGGGIGMLETVGHVDFYPNGGEVQVGCTASNSIKSLLEKGVVEGARTVVCSHMRAPMLFTETINGKHCPMLASECDSWENYVAGNCDFCQRSGPKCADMGYHVDMNRNYGNGTKFYFMTASDPPYCGYEYKVKLDIATDEALGASLLIPAAWRRTGFSKSDVLHVSIQGVRSSLSMNIEGKSKGWQSTHVFFSQVFLGDIVQVVLRWSKQLLPRPKGVMDVISNVIQRDPGIPVVTSVQISPMKAYSLWDTGLRVYTLCANPILLTQQELELNYKQEYC